MIKITFPDGNTKQFEKGSSALDIAKTISEGLAREVLAAKINGELVDATKEIEKDSKLQLLTAKDSEGLEVLRHSAAHLLAHAVQRLYPKAQPTIGPVIENGFYYDFDKLDIKEEDLATIEAEMKKIAKEKIPTRRIEHDSKEETIKEYHDNPYKVELIREFDEASSSYEQGDFQDLCRGPHIPNTGIFKNCGIKLDKMAGAYWRGKSENTMLTRIYGLCFATKKELNEFLELRAEAEKRDHRKIGKEMKLFTISPLIGAGLPLFQPKGMILRKEVEDFLWELHKLEGYSRVWSPHIAKVALYETSGHAEKFGDELFHVKGKEEEFIIKPMNCPHHMQIFKDNTFSYRDLPIKYFEPATIYRDEKSGQLTGLTRVRAITQDDGHLFVRFDQIEKEICSITEIIRRFYSTLGMTDDYWVSLSVRGDNEKMYLGDKKLWNKAEEVLKKAAEKSELPFTRMEGEAAFYGPKLDFMFKDCLGREWQLATIQCDFNLPERFKLSYVNEKGEKERPVVIHRAISGSLERFCGLLIEHFAGKFPLWLAPVQVKILPIADRHNDYAHSVAQQMRENDLRVEVDESAETIKKKVREAQLERVNYILVVGDNEVDEGTVTVRTRDEKVHGAKKVDQLIKDLNSERDVRRLPSY